MPNSLEKLVTRRVAATKKAEADAAAEEARKEAAFKSRLPKTREARAKLVYPSITDGDDWGYDPAAGDWRLNFKVAGVQFFIGDKYIPADDGTPTEGYGPTKAHWAKYLWVVPENEYAHELGYVGDVDDSFLAALKDPNNDHLADTKKWFAEEVKKVGDRIANLVENFLLNKDNYRYRESLRAQTRRGW